MSDEETQAHINVDKFYKERGTTAEESPHLSREAVEIFVNSFSSESAGYEALMGML